MESSGPSQRGRLAEDAVADWLRGEAARILKLPPSELQPDSRWVDDLEADSLDMTELAAAVESRFELRIEDAELMTLPTVGSVCELIRDRLDGSGPSPVSVR